MEMEVVKGILSGLTANAIFSKIRNRWSSAPKPPTRVEEPPEIEWTKDETEISISPDGEIEFKKIRESFKTRGYNRDGTPCIPQDEAKFDGKG